MSEVVGELPEGALVEILDGPSNVFNGLAKLRVLAGREVEIIEGPNKIFYRVRHDQLSGWASDIYLENVEVSLPFSAQAASNRYKTLPRLSEIQRLSLWLAVVVAFAGSVWLARYFFIGEQRSGVMSLALILTVAQALCFWAVFILVMAVYASLAKRSLGHRYTKLSIHSTPEPGDVQLIYHTYHGLILSWFLSENSSRHVTHHGWLAPDEARNLLGRLFRFNLIWGQLAPPLFGPLLALINYVIQRLSIASQEKAGGFPHGVHRVLTVKRLGVWGWILAGAITSAILVLISWFLIPQSGSHAEGNARGAAIASGLFVFVIFGLLARDSTKKDRSN